jgi:hypothetical protein
VAVDGTTVRANRSGHALAAAKEALTQALEEAEQADADIPEEEPGPSAGDEEAEFMKTSEGIKPAYNAQLVVDSAHQVIVAQEVMTQASDKGHLPVMVGQVEANCNAPPEGVSADGGYYAEAPVEQLEGQGSKVYLPLPESGERKFEWVEEQGAYRCPQGHLLHRYRERRGRQIYRTHHCKGCPRTAACGVKGQVKEIHVPLPGTPLGRLAGRMRTAEGQAIYAARQQIVEPVFAWFKHNRGFRRFLLRGRRGVSAEWSLMCIVHNLAKWAQAVGEAGSDFSPPKTALHSANLAHVGTRAFSHLHRRLQALFHHWIRICFRLQLKWGMAG